MRQSFPHLKVFLREIAGDFNAAARPPEGLPTGNLLEAIYAERPELEEQRVYVPSQGMFSHAVIIGDEVFKAPTGRIEAFNREWRVLKMLEGTGLPVPKVTHVGAQAHFYSMTRLQGIVLGEENFHEMSRTEQRRIASDLAAFVDGMAKAIPEDKIDPGFKGERFLGSFLDPEAIGPVLADGDTRRTLGEDRWRECSALLTDYLPRLRARKAGLFHDDLNTRNGNILIDPATKALAGIIDFGMLDYSRPESMIMKNSLTEPFSKMVIEEYMRLQGDDFSMKDVYTHQLGHILCEGRSGEGAKSNWLYRINHVLDTIRNCTPRDAAASHPRMGF